jgi:hypothetical protein
MQPPTADLDTDQQPPLALPFAHFLLGGALLVVGGGVAGLGPLVLPIRASSVGTLHLLLAGWIGLTIMGAMVQFVPVWSGTRLHSERLSLASLWLVVLGVVGLVGTFFAGTYGGFPFAAAPLVAGFWLFGYVIVRSLPPLRALDITEAHFLAAICALLIATVLGWLLATDLQYRLLDPTGIDRHGLLMAHLTLTVFGFVTLTIVGALYQLAPMFTQAPDHRADAALAHVEMVALPAGVFLLAAGRLSGSVVLSRFAAALVLAGVAAFALVLLRRLAQAQVDLGPMLQRYWVVGGSALGWVLLTVPHWLSAPTSYFARFGSPQGTHLLFVGVFTVTILGTFYHVVPFIIWFHEYSDRLGLEPVPMIDDLYDDRLARIDFWLVLAGLGALWAGELLTLPTWFHIAGGNLLGVGVLLFAVNMGLVVARHRPATIREVIALLAFKKPEDAI